jgi:hypothetical protein
MLACRAVERRRGAAWMTAGGAVLTLLAAFMIYQPGAMIFFVFIAIDLFRPGGVQTQWIRRLGLTCAMAAVAMAGDWLLFHAAAGWFDARQFPGAPLASRAATIPLADLPHKIAFFIATPLNESLRGPAIFLPAPASVAIGIFIAAGLLLYFPGRLLPRLLCLAAALALAPVTFLCNLLTTDDAAAYRMQVALECLIAVYAIFAIQGWWRAARTVFAGRDFVPSAAPAGLAVASCILASHYFTAYLAMPQAIEWSAVGATVRQLDAQGVSRVEVIRITDTSPVFAPAHQREFGLPTSTRDFAAADIVRAALRTLRPELRDTPVELANSFQPTTSAWPAGTAVIDLRHLQPMGSTVHP